MVARLQLLVRHTAKLCLRDTRVALVGKIHSNALTMAKPTKWVVTSFVLLVFLATLAKRPAVVSHKYMNQKNNQQGFTLIELLLYVSISSVILLVTSLFLSSLLESRIKNQTIAEVEQQGLQVMQIITQTARNAEVITSPALGASASSLTLDVITVANDPTIFDLAGGAIRITEGGGSAISITNSRVTASALTFQNLSRASTPGTVRIQFTLTHVNPAGRNEYSFTKTFVGSATLRQP